MAQDVGQMSSPRIARTLQVRPVRILLVEDSPLLAGRLAEAIAEMPRFEVVDAVDTEALALQLIKRSRIDVVLLDLHLRQGTGLGVLRALARLPRRPFTVILTNHDLPEYHAAALELGATDFLDKARAFQRLPKILEETALLFEVD